MKKVLSFVLVLAMVLGSVSMAFAATTEYKDQAEITNTEAVAALSMLKVLEGDANGFRPKDTLTRAEAAAIVARLKLGRTDADKLSASASSFKDVPATHWAAGYIAYCVSEGIIAGNGDGTFTPEGVLTVSAFTKMMLCALGYSAAREGLTGANWEANTAALAVKAGISVKATGNCTRETAAQLGLNALEADVVHYDDGDITVQAGGATVTVGGSSYKKTAAAAPTYDNRALVGSYKKLVEEVYGSDVKKLTGTDDFGYPTKKWTYKNDDAEVAKTPAVVFNKNLNTTAGKKEIASSLKNYTILGDTNAIKSETTALATNVAINLPHLAGFTSATAIAAHIAAQTTKGGIVAVFVNSDNEIYDVVQTLYTVGKVNSITTNKDGDVTYSISNAVGTLKDYADDDKNTDTVKVEGTIAKGDYVTFVQPAGKPTYVYPTTKVTGVQTAYVANTSVTVDGTTYNIGTGVKNWDDSNYSTNGSSAANYFVDQYGFVVATSDVEAENEYAVVYRIAAIKGSGTANSTEVEAQLVFADGTKSTVKISKINELKASKVTITTTAIGLTIPGTTATAINMSDTYGDNAGLAGAVVSYKAKSDGTYEISYVDAAVSNKKASVAGIIKDKGVPTIVGVATKAATTTKFVVQTKKTDGTAVFTAYEGFANVPTVSGAGVSYGLDSNGKLAFVFFDATDGTSGASDTTTKYFYATTKDNSVAGSDSDKVYSIAGYIDGEKTSISDDASINIASSKAIYAVTFDEKGYVDTIAMFNSADADKGTVATVASISEIEGGSFDGRVWDDNTKVYVIEDGVLEEGDMNSIYEGAYVYYVLKSQTSGTAAEKNTIKVLFVSDAAAGL